MVHTLKRIIVVDTDEFNNKILEVVSRKISSEIPLEIYKDSQVAIDYIRKNPRADEKMIFFVNLDMQDLPGFEFIKQLKTIYLGEQMLTKRIMVMTPVVDPEEMAKAKSTQDILHYLVKPLTSETIRLIMLSAMR